MADINILNINPEMVCSLIVKAREFHAKEEVTFSEENPQTEYEYDWAQILADHQDDFTYLEVKNVIKSLSYDEQIDLLSLMYLGRDDFDDWESAHQAAINNFIPNLTDYLLAHPYIADYWESALDILEYNCEK
ncbi:DUF3775 domain-containing protein [Legionella israelensis]|uniref:DUF3775 domain-containing protein n=1 Tax=Legionella israelensis TaxID=454 RepID=A0A0W0V4A6_9GAMM|nr:DUF3775 domain-containing protein [Legionella israelensis]KTD14946.1 hypothetical protein Lisr_2291 [Legionella israelensis]QBR83047.1 DUF3775 domain-containing protein [Legionella israelensis]QBS09589.1 DUF3775 domain-containing protein [Legionella israelensis]QDP71579.1 DUF3775 domain-containing protein [Legionella israelensis]SCY23766.1 Protein of unknown function [Legionella israelensis DSM 19235]